MNPFKSDKRQDIGLVDIKYFLIAAAQRYRSDTIGSGIQPEVP